MSERYTHLDSIKVDGIASTSQQGALIGASKVMPQPSADLDGVTIQYMGPTDSTYTFKRMYTCAMVGSEYKWVDATPVDIVQNSNGVFIGGNEIAVADSTTYGVMSPDQAEKVESSFVKLETVTEGAEPNKVDIIRVEGTPLQVSGSDKSVNITRTSLGLGDSAQLDTGTLEGQIPVLGANGLLPDSTIPPSAIGTFINSVRTKALLTSLSTAKLGDWAKVTSDDDFNNNGVYILNGTAPGVLTNWVQMVGPANVESVNGKSGRVVLDKEDIGLANVDNTSDAKKPISEAMQSALNLKADDSVVVHKTGNENIGGDKTFGGQVLINGDWNNLTMIHPNADSDNPPSDVWLYKKVIFLDKNNNRMGELVNTLDTDGSHSTALRAWFENSAKYTNGYTDLGVRRYTDGTAYGMCPSWKVGTADNSDTILTTKMANSLPSLVHTTGNETIAGVKNFTNIPYITNNRPFVYFRAMDSEIGVFGNQDAGIRFGDKNDSPTGGVYNSVGSDGSYCATSVLAYTKNATSGNLVGSRIILRAYQDGTVTASAPVTTDTASDDAIVTKKYLLDKIAALEARIATLEAKP